MAEERSQKGVGVGGGGREGGIAAVFFGKNIKPCQPGRALRLLAL